MTAVTDAPTRVLAVVVAHDGMPWLADVLDGLTRQSHPALDIVAVDNASGDGSRELLIERLGEARVLSADRDLGFGGAVAMALDARSDAPYVLHVHDDLVLEPDALAHLVAALDEDPRLAVVGPKLRTWGADRELQAVGWSIDLTGRVDSGVDPGELDQGQRDQERRVLAVSTAGMLARREVLDALGGFDRRYHVFRDDLDLCWRVWLAGSEVEVVPTAVGVHAAGVSTYQRLGQARHLGPRYFAERNTLTTLLKNYGSARLALVLPLFLAVGVAKVAGFLLTRRFGDAWQTLRAWLWNLLHLRETIRYRRRVQALRRRGDPELASLFARIGPRLRAYAEAMASWVAGGDVSTRAEPGGGALTSAPARPGLARLFRVLRRRPTLVAGALIGLVVLVGAWPLLLPGELRGGELAPWPATPLGFFADYVAGWHEAGAFGTGAAPSPAQPLLGLLQVAMAGSSYLAPRVLLLAPMLVGWLFALRAAQSFSRRRLPRVVAATAYVLSPPAVAALQTGRVGALIALAVLPGIIAGGLTFARRRTPAGRAWRSVAGVALLGAVGGAFEPLLLLAVVVAGSSLVAVGLARASDRAWRLALLARSSVAVLGPVILLLPWSVEALLQPSFAAWRAPGVGDELWRWLLLAPSVEGFPGLLAGVGFGLAGVLGLVFGVRRRPGLVAALWMAAVLGAVGGWWLDRTASATWAGLPLVLSAAALAALFALAFATSETQLARHAFGWRQLAAGTTAAAVGVSVAAVAVSLVRADWEAYELDEPALPSFVMASAVEDGPFRVLVLADDGGVVSWEVVDGRGPSMVAYGVPAAPAPWGMVADTLAAVLDGTDPVAGDRLGQLGVRHVVVPPGRSSDALADALLAQTGLEPRPVAAGELYTVSSWLPHGSVLRTADVAVLDTYGYLPEDALVRPLSHRGGGRYTGAIPDDAVVMVAEHVADGWHARVGDETRRAEPRSLVRFTDLPDGMLRVEYLGTTARGLAVTGQVLAVLLAISLALRPPGFARAHPPTRRQGTRATSTADASSPGGPGNAGKSGGSR